MVKYYLKTYGKIKREYQSWVEIPKEWETFAELISVLIEAADWKQDYKCLGGNDDKVYRRRVHL